jgi:DNA-binding NarL/FixJ family response regulator
MTIRVLHADDSESYRRLLRVLLAGDEAIELVGEAGDADELLAALPAARPDVVLLDQLGGCDLLDRVRAAAPGAAVVVLSGFAAADDPSGLAARADGYVVKSPVVDELRACVLRVAGRA